MKKNDVYWDNFYNDQYPDFKESEFAKFILKWINQKCIILDVGCGSGRDSFYFAQHGNKVIGIDKSYNAINNNIKRIRNTELSLEFLQVDLDDRDKFGNIVYSLQTNATKKNKLFIVYFRFLLHSITEDTEDKIFQVLSEYLNENSYVVAEFRTIEDKERSKVYNNHYRRYVDTKSFLNKIEKGFLFEIQHFEKGTGFSEFKDEDPYLARLILKKRIN